MGEFAPAPAGSTGEFQRPQISGAVHQRPHRAVVVGRSLFQSAVPGAHEHRARRVVRGREQFGGGGAERVGDALQ
ncbi:hypothetical protein [Nocardia brasiliensis]|uniref:hypothetical protein n=1 Tax=Nocardia brasiliensis TaxID=37326 RepID=UPI002455F4C6|nr:hypothetical protein [Nocardia brasiliensis]